MAFASEAVVQVKKGVNCRTSAVPELLIASDLLMGDALARLHADEPQHARFDDLVPKYQAQLVSKVNLGDEGGFVAVVRQAGTAATLKSVAVAPLVAAAFTKRGHAFMQTG